MQTSRKNSEKGSCGAAPQPPALDNQQISKSAEWSMECGVWSVVALARTMAGHRVTASPRPVVVVVVVDSVQSFKVQSCNHSLQQQLRSRVRTLNFEL